jgi:UDP-N-acetylmuramoyl-L-alanyl-D-glutamate--2,6-diaminopimelate ligase
VIVIAGKGHEDYQEIKGVKHHFDDREVVKEIFESQSK